MRGGITFVLVACPRDEHDRRKRDEEQEGRVYTEGLRGGAYSSRRNSPISRLLLYECLLSEVFGRSQLIQTRSRADFVSR